MPLQRVHELAVGEGSYQVVAVPDRNIWHFFEMKNQFMDSLFMHRTYRSQTIYSATYKGLSLADQFIN